MKKHYLNTLLTASLLLSIFTPSIYAKDDSRNDETQNVQNTNQFDDELDFKLTEEEEKINEAIVEEIDNYITQAID